MIYKNGIKENVMIGVSTAVLFGIIMGIFIKNLYIGIISGVIYSIFYTTYIIIMAKVIEKKIVSIREAIMKEKNIICEGTANYRNGLLAFGGWAFLTEDSIIFYPHKLNIRRKEVIIPLKDIVEVKKSFNNIIINTMIDSHKLTVNKPANWQRTIEIKLKQLE